MALPPKLERLIIPQKKRSRSRIIFKTTRYDTTTDSRRFNKKPFNPEEVNQYGLLTTGYEKHVKKEEKRYEIGRAKLKKLPKRLFESILLVEMREDKEQQQQQKKKNQVKVICSYPFDKEQDSLTEEIKDSSIHEHLLFLTSPRNIFVSPLMSPRNFNGGNSPSNSPRASFNHNYPLNNGMALNMLEKKSPRNSFNSPRSSNTQNTPHHTNDNETDGEEEEEEEVLDWKYFIESEELLEMLFFPWGEDNRTHEAIEGFFCSAQLQNSGQRCFVNFIPNEESILYGICMLLYEPMIEGEEKWNPLDMESIMKRIKITQGIAQEEDFDVLNDDGEEDLMNQSRYSLRCLCMFTRVPFFDLHFALLEEIAMRRKNLIQINLGLRPYEEHNSPADPISAMNAYLQQKLPAFGSQINMQIPNSLCNDSSLYLIDMPVLGRDGLVARSCLGKLFHALGISTVINLLGYLMIQINLVFHSKWPGYSSHCIMALLTLLKPYCWPGTVHTAVAPELIVDMIQIPSPFIFGTTCEFDTLLKVDDFPPTVVIINLDKRAITRPLDATYRVETMWKMPRFGTLRSQIREHLLRFYRKCKFNPNNNFHKVDKKTFFTAYKPPSPHSSSNSLSSSSSSSSSSANSEMEFILFEDHDSSSCSSATEYDENNEEDFQSLSPPPEVKRTTNNSPITTSTTHSSPQSTPPRKSSSYILHSSSSSRKSSSASSPDLSRRTHHRVHSFGHSSSAPTSLSASPSSVMISIPEDKPSAMKSHAKCNRPTNQTPSKNKKSSLTKSLKIIPSLHPSSHHHPNTNATPIIDLESAPNIHLLYDPSPNLNMITPDVSYLDFPWEEILRVLRNYHLILLENMVMIKSVDSLDGQHLPDAQDSSLDFHPLQRWKHNFDSSHRNSSRLSEINRRKMEINFMNLFCSTEIFSTMEPVISVLNHIYQDKNTTLQQKRDHAYKLLFPL